MVTLSPVLYSFFSSCALYLVVTLKYFPSNGCFLRRITATTTVFCILSDTTTPSNFLFLLILSIDFRSAGFKQNQFSGMNSGKIQGAKSDACLMYVSDKQRRSLLEFPR